ncbi:MAG: topoisomerase C-terminal repeat-containing protein [Fibrobacter sp.]|nr:topoisomerase C-terminal repeat-containing protein [Fibrobacter sp.]
MILLVAEKPSVANQHYRPMLERLEGEKFTQGDGCLIGQNHCITWCVGHLITLAPLDAYPGYEGPWRLSNLPLLPEKFRLMEIESTKKQLNVVRSMMEKADVLVNGADAGREGNLIFDLVLDFTPAFKQKKIMRLWVNSYVAKDLDNAWKHLEDATERVNLSYAARLRQRADWMVGLNATRAYTLTAGRGKMISVGRVQTPTLNLVVERDTLVEQFKELFYYSVIGTWKSFGAQLLRDEKVAVFEKEAQAAAVVEKCSPPEMATISKIDIQQKKQFPQKPFDLTELQKEGNKRFKFSAQQVLDCAQNLYEKKLLTYPRTDSAYLPDTMKGEAYALAQRLASPEQKNLMRDPNDNFVFINSSKVTDHFAIIPTGEVPQNLPEMEQKIYELAKERFISAWLKPYIWSEMEVMLQCPEEESETFRLKLKHNEDLGFRAIVKEEKKKKTSKKSEGSDSVDDDDSNEITNLVEEFPQWNVGDKAPVDSVELQKKKKSKPKYYTEATLLAAMKTAGKQIENEELAEARKDRGLGTPATQAGIIETLKKRGFIEAQKNYLVSTPRGREVISLMDEKVKSPEMTGEWEYQLSQVEKGNLSPVEFRDGIIEYVKSLFSELHAKYQCQFDRESVTEALPCPKCGSPLEIAPWGYVCHQENCGFKVGHTIAGRMLSHDEMKTLLASGTSNLLSGFKSKKGSTFSATLVLNEEGNISFDFSENPDNRVPTEFKCPKCGKKLLDAGNRLVCEGSSVENAEPGCDFTLYKTIASRVLEDAELQELFTQGTTSVLSGFQTKKGSSFNAKITWDKDFHATFAFENDGHFHGTETKYKCPICKHVLEENKNAIFCPAENCKFTLFKTVAGKKLRAGDIKALLLNGKTELIQGFKSKKGSTFDAVLTLGEDGRTNFEFPRHHFPCPVCNDQLRFRNDMYACKNPHCGFAIPKVFYGRELSDEEVEKLLTDKISQVLEPFQKGDTTFRAAIEIRDGGKLAFHKESVQVIPTPRQLQSSK